MAITNVIFDIGRVLNEYDWTAYLRKTVPDETAYRAVEKAIFLNPVWVEHDLGLLTREEEIQDFIAAAPAYEKEIRAVYENLGEVTWVFDYAYDWVKEIKDKGYRVYALSNWPEHLYEQRGNNLDFLDLMDGYCLSFQEHLNKPNPAAFTNLFAKFEIDPAKSVYIDDSPSNIEVAKSLGMKAFLFTSYEDVKEKLMELGI